MEGVQHKAFLKLLGLQYKLVYRKGKDNGAADALSRKEPQEESHAISTSVPKWMEIVTEGYNKDEHNKKLLSELSLVDSNNKGFTL
jgi:hypothetical protein